MYLLIFRYDSFCAEVLVCGDVAVLLADDRIILTIPYLETRKLSVLSAP